VLKASALDDSERYRVSRHFEFVGFPLRMGEYRATRRWKVV
jgi:hypothetical protein